MAESAFEHCRRITQRFGSRFYDASHFLPLAQRSAAWAVYAFCRVSDNLADEPISHRGKHFSRWRHDVLAALDGHCSNHVLNAFVQTVHDFSIDPALPLELLDGVAQDLNFQGYSTLSELEDYAYQVASVPGLMTARVFDAPHEADSYAVKLGVAMQLTNIVRDVVQDAHLCRVYLPQDLLSEFGLAASDVLDDPASPNLRPVLSLLSRRANQLYAVARPGLALVPKSARACAAACLSSYAQILDNPHTAMAQTL